MAKKTKAVKKKDAPPAIRSEDLQADIAELRSLAETYSLSAMQGLDGLEAAIMKAEGISRLRAALTPSIMQPIMELMNTTIGFDTDRNPNKKNKDGTFPTPYSEAVVKDFIIETLMRGFEISGGEVMIMSGKCYGTKTGMLNQVRRFPGVTQLRMRPGQIDRATDSSVRVSFISTWLLDGKPHELRSVYSEELDERIPVRVNQGQGADAVLGKATRKQASKIFFELSGHELPDEGDGVPLPAAAVDAENVKPAQPKPATLDDLKPLSVLGWPESHDELAALLSDGQLEKLFKGRSADEAELLSACCQRFAKTDFEISTILRVSEDYLHSIGVRQPGDEDDHDDDN